MHRYDTASTQAFSPASTDRLSATDRWAMYDSCGQVTGGNRDIGRARRVNRKGSGVRMRVDEGRIGLNPSRDKNEGRHRSGQGGGLAVVGPSG